MTTREQIIAAAIQADSGFSGGPDYDGTMGESIIGMTAIERFFDIAFGDGAASRDAEIVELRKQVTRLRDAVMRAKNRIQGLSEMLLPEKDTCKYIDDALAATETKP